MSVWHPGWGIDVNGQGWQIPPIGSPISLCHASRGARWDDVSGANQHLSKGWRSGWVPLDGNPAPVWSYHDKGESSRLPPLLHIHQLRRRTKDQDLLQVQARGLHHGRPHPGHLHWRWKGGCDGITAQASPAPSLFTGKATTIQVLAKRYMHYCPKHVITACLGQWLNNFKYIE